MNGKKLKDMTEAELNKHYRELRIRRNCKELRKYADRLHREVKNYGRKFEAIAINQRKSRALAMGECALKALEDVRAESKKHYFKPDSRYYIISERPERDENGKKYFHEMVMWAATSYEPAHTEEEIQKELEETFEKMMRETDELYPAEEKDGQG